MSVSSFYSRYIYQCYQIICITRATTVWVTGVYSIPNLQNNDGNLLYLYADFRYQINLYKYQKQWKTTHSQNGTDEKLHGKLLKTC